MRTQVVTLVCAALFAAGCGGGGNGDSQSGITDQAVPALATQDSPAPSLVSTVVQDSQAATATVEGGLHAFAQAEINELLKQGDTLLLTGSAGLVALRPSDASVLVDEPVAAATFFGGRLWIATEGALATVDGLVKIVPEFATAFTALAVYGDDLYAGTAGDGVWKLEAGRLEPVSEAWQVRDLAATNFGLFAATNKGLFSFTDDRWRLRRLDDTSTALSNPTVLYSRYPYLYVGTGNDLVRFDGGDWKSFGLSFPVSALGWHNARLYIGTTSGGLFALAGDTVTAEPSPGLGAVSAILRFDGRLHVAAGSGLYRLRHGRFEEIDWDVPAESEPKHEPIAFLL